MARSFLRKENQAKFSAGNQSRIEISRNFHHQYLFCKLVVTHDNGVTPVFKTDDFANLINSIQIVANGNKTIKNVDVKKLVYNAIYDKGRGLPKTLVTTASTTGSVSTLFFTIDFSKRGVVRPADTIENSANYTTFDMLIDWANSAAVGTGVTVTGAELHVSSHQLVGYQRNVGERTSHNIETQSTNEVTSTTSDFQIQLPVKMIYQRLVIAARVDGNRNNLVINAVKLKSGTTVFAEWNADDLRADNSDKASIATITDLDGLLLLDFIARGRNSDAIDTRGEFNTLELVLDVTKQTGTNTVTVYSDVFDIENVIENKG